LWLKRNWFTASISKGLFDREIDLKLIFATSDEVERKYYTIYHMFDSCIGYDKEFNFTIDIV
jgi:hypothetical protein